MSKISFDTDEMTVCPLCRAYGPCDKAECILRQEVKWKYEPKSDD